MICNWKQQFDIQRFAEGGAAGGAAAAAGSAADAGQPGEGAGAGAQSAPNAAQTGQDATAGETPRDLKAEFDALVKGEYKGEFDARVQKIINQRFPKAKAAEEANGKMQAAMDVLAQRYSLKADDYDGIAAALNDDQKLYEEAAGEAGMDVKQFMRVQQLERENARYQRQQAELAQRLIAIAVGEIFAQQAQAGAQRRDIAVNGLRIRRIDAEHAVQRDLHRQRFRLPGVGDPAHLRQRLQHSAQGEHAALDGVVFDATHAAWFLGLA